MAKNSVHGQLSTASDRLFKWASMCPVLSSRWSVLHTFWALLVNSYLSMKLHSPCILRGASLLFVALTCHASPLSNAEVSRRSDSLVKVLTSKRPPRLGNLCTSDDIEKLQGGISDLKLLTTAAAKILVKPGASQLEPVQAYLGSGISPQIKSSVVTDLVLSVGR